jgi:hypothetical protein
MMAFLQLAWKNSFVFSRVYLRPNDGVTTGVEKQFCISTGVFMA